MKTRLDGDSRRFIQKLSEVRNKFVHDVENVTTTLSDFFASLEEGDRRGFVKAFKWGYANADDVDIQTEDGLYDIHKTLKMLAVTTWNIHHKISIWAGSLVVLRQVHQKITDSKIDSLRRQYNDEVGLILKEVIDAKKRIDNDDTVPELKVAEPSTS